MSQYPHPYGYGQYHGQPLPHPSHPYGYQSASGYPAPPYNAPYNSTAADLNRDVAQVSFDYNATHIPGLGMPGVPGAAPGGTHSSTAPWPAAWSHAQVPPASAPSAPSAQTYTAGSLSAQPPPRAQLGVAGSGPGGSNGANTANNKPVPAPAPAPARPAADIDIEEGELSEGQFEDLYEPRESVSPDVTESRAPKPPPISHPSQPASAADTPDGGFYGTDEDDGEKAPRNTEGTTPRLLPSQA